MERSPQRRIPRTLVATVVAATLFTQAGCVGLLSNLLYDGHMIPARYAGLEKQKVAVVCVSNDSIYTPYSTTAQLASRIERLLGANVEEIEVVGQDRVADWMDNNDWDQVDADYRRIGKGIGADKIVAIEIPSFSLHDGKTMYKGRCEVNVAVYDLTTGGRKELILDGFPVVYPANGAQSTAARTDQQFNKEFLNVVAHQIATNFYRHDLKEDLALDATFIGS